MSSRFPLHLRLAAAVRRLPDVPGRQALWVWLRDLRPGDHEVEISICGLRFQGPLELMKQLATLRWVRPALAPIFDAALGPGAVLADVGAHLGMYALWGARRVGPEGRVYAFEPVATSADRVRAAARLNGFSNVEVVVSALGSEHGSVELHVPKRATGAGISSRYHQTTEEETLRVGQTTLDDFFADRPPPALVKIDVEGMEAEVLRGGSRLLQGEQAPAVVLEAAADLLELAGSPYGGLVESLQKGGWSVWALGPEGLRREAAGVTEPGSMNVLITRDDLDRHRDLLRRLAGVRFPRNQNE